MRYARCIIIAVAALLIAGQAFGTQRNLILEIRTVPLAWGDSKLNEKCETVFSRNSDLRVTFAGGEGTSLTFPDARYDIDSLVNWGLEAGGRYLLTVTVEREGLERRKGFNLPLIFHKFETVGVIEGEFRLIDIQKGKLLAAESFDVELKGPRQFQAEWDQNRNDPSLHISAPEKSKFFSRLEEKLADKLAKKIGKLVKGR